MLRLLKGGEWVLKRDIVVALRKACAPEMLIRKQQSECERPSRMRSNKLTLEHQAWAGAGAAVCHVVSLWKRNGILETRNLGTPEVAYRLIRLPKCGKRGMLVEEA